MDADAFLEAFVTWAEGHEDVQALLLLGSRARTEAPADEWSDVDLALVVTEPDWYLGDEQWVEAFGRPLLTFVEPTAGGAFERRVLYEGGLDVDVAVFTPEWLLLAAADPQTASLIKRGYRVLVDRIGLAAIVARAASAEPKRGLPTQRELADLASDRSPVDIATSAGHRIIDPASRARRSRVPRRRARVRVPLVRSVGRRRRPWGPR